jgi:hypothetical protein
LLSIVRHINFVGDRLVDHTTRPAFESWVRRTLRPVVASTGWDPSPHETPSRQTIRADVLYTLGYAARDPEVLSEARRRVDRFLTTGTPLDPGLAGTLLQLAAINGDARLYEQYAARVTGSGSRGERINFRDALSYFTAPDLQRRVPICTSADVRPQDAPDHRRAHATSVVRGRGLKHEAELAGAPAVSWNISGLPQIVGSTQSFCDTASRDDVEQFLGEHGVRVRNAPRGGRWKSWIAASPRRTSREESVGVSASRTRPA